MSVPLLDLHVLWERHREATEAAIARVLASQSFILGDEVTRFEADVAAWLGGGVEAIGVANGSDAIVLALRALGIGSGDEVICPTFTFVSTATSVALVGATPIFVDVEADSFNLDVPRALDAVTPSTRAVIAVHLFGRAADVDRLRSGLDAMGRDDVVILEDAAQSLGASLEGAPVGTLTGVATTSFFPSKNLGCFGDGGMVMATPGPVASRVRMLRQHGSKVKYFNEVIGMNSRLDAIQAAILGTKLPLLRGWCDERRANAAAYHAAFADLDPERIALPAGDGGGRYGHIYNQFTLRCSDRDALIDHLSRLGIGTAIYYPRTLHEQPCFEDIASRSPACPVGEALARTSVSIPVYPGLRGDQRDQVIDAVRTFARA